MKIIIALLMISIAVELCGIWGISKIILDNKNLNIKTHTEYVYSLFIMLLGIFINKYIEIKLGYYISVQIFLLIQFCICEFNLIKSKKITRYIMIAISILFAFAVKRINEFSIYIVPAILTLESLYIMPKAKNKMIENNLKAGNKNNYEAEIFNLMIFSIIMFFTIIPILHDQVLTLYQYVLGLSMVLVTVTIYAIIICYEYIKYKSESRCTNEARRKSCNLRTVQLPQSNREKH